MKEAASACATMLLCAPMGSAVGEKTGRCLVVLLLSSRRILPEPPFLTLAGGAATCALLNLGMRGHAV